SPPPTTIPQASRRARRSGAGASSGDTAPVDPREAGEIGAPQTQEVPGRCAELDAEGLLQAHARIQRVGEPQQPALAVLLRDQSARQPRRLVRRPQAATTGVEVLLSG